MQLRRSSLGEKNSLGNKENEKILSHQNQNFRVGWGGLLKSLLAQRCSSPISIRFIETVLFVMVYEILCPNPNLMASFVCHEMAKFLVYGEET